MVNLDSDNTFYKSTRPSQDNNVTKSCVRIEGESNTAWSQIRSDHHLHSNFTLNNHVVEPVVETVGNGAVSEDRRKAIQHLLGDTWGSINI